MSGLNNEFAELLDAWRIEMNHVMDKIGDIFMEGIQKIQEAQRNSEEILLQVMVEAEEDAIHSTQELESRVEFQIVMNEEAQVSIPSEAISTPISEPGAKVQEKASGPTDISYNHEALESKFELKANGTPELGQEQLILQCFIFTHLKAGLQNFAFIINECFK